MRGKKNIEAINTALRVKRVSEAKWKKDGQCQMWAE